MVDLADLWTDEAKAAIYEEHINLVTDYDRRVVIDSFHIQQQLKRFDIFFAVRLPLKENRRRISFWKDRFYASS